MNKIFVSHSSKNESFIKKLKDYFPERDYLIWVSFDNIRPGENFDDAIIKNLKDCDCIIFILTKEALKSDYVNQEIGYALAFEKEIVPVIENFDNLPGFLKRKRALKLYIRSPKQTYLEILPKLPNRELYKRNPYKESAIEKTLRLTVTGNDMWIEILNNMEKAPTPISSFVGVFSTYMKRNKTYRKMIDKRFNTFIDFFVESGMAEPVELNEEMRDQVYDYLDLKKWENNWNKPVLYKLSDQGKIYLKRMKKMKAKTQIGDTIEWKIKLISTDN